jgi:hypothetical protein
MERRLGQNNIYAERTRTDSKEIAAEDEICNCRIKARKAEMHVL